MDEDRLYYRHRAEEHRARAATAIGNPARLVHLALADAYERRCTGDDGAAADGEIRLSAVG